MDIKKILKFGGSSISNPERIRKVASIVLDAARKERVVVVVSAFQGVTNQLLECAQLAEAGDPKFQSLYKTLVKRHMAALKTLHHNHPPKHVAANLQTMLAELCDVLQGIYLLRHGSPRALDLTASFGERLSALTIASFLQQSQPSCFVDSRSLVKTDDHFTRASVQFDKTNRAIKSHFKKLFEQSSKRLIPVVTGFIGSTDDGLTTTIGRNGSDYSAAIFGAALDVSLIEIWTDVDGVLTADDMRLRKPAVQQQFKEAAKQAGLQVASLAIGELNSIPYKSDPRTVQWVSDSIDVCKALGVRVVLLAFFSNDDLRDDRAGVDEVVRRLKAVAPKAEKAGVMLGIESWLSAEQHLDILERVGSKAVKVYYDVCNSTDRGYDIYKEIRKLGKRICEFHCKENGALLGHGNVDFHKVRAALDDIGYRGWLQIEGAVPPGKPMLESYQANCKFMREILA